MLKQDKSIAHSASKKAAKVFECSSVSHIFSSLIETQSKTRTTNWKDLTTIIAHLAQLLYVVSVRTNPSENFCRPKK